ncbi:MAG TPA: biosynthetic arginine decarboxylase, partial [Phycisphaerales bacterium]|nr:biosynthetic arginine decarboxylase [Phycisphaerales bacterium]
VSELARLYCELRRMGAGLDTIDIGGGLGVDYDGSNSAWPSSVNYSLAEYASDVVYRIKTACDDAGQPHPDIISESGRALSAHSSVLIFNILGRARFRGDPDMPWVRRLIEAEEGAGGEIPQPVRDLLQAWEAIDNAEAMDDAQAAEAYHDALQARTEARTLFNLGYLSLPMRAVADRLYWAIGRTILRLTEGRAEGGLPDQIDGLPEQLSDICFCNFSLFQSLPDSWAIGQIFPIMPIQRLDEKPTRRAILADITCDSDGRITRFGCADQRECKPTIEVHDTPIGDDGTLREPYYMAAFLVGAYQEVLGDLHNLFGDTHAVHVSLHSDGWRIDDVVEGDTVREVLGYVQFDVDALRRSMRRETERAVRRGSMSVAESRNLLRFYEQGLEGYTYLE